MLTSKKEVTKEDVAREIRSFLIEQGFEFGAYSNRYHTVGIGYHCALVKPEYSPKHGGYTLAVTPTAVVGYACSQPYNTSSWYEVWKTNYNSQKELLEILQNAITPPRGCWG